MNLTTIALFTMALLNSGAMAGESPSIAKLESHQALGADLKAEWCVGSMNQEVCDYIAGTIATNEQLMSRIRLCYGKKGQSPIDYIWHKCEATSLKTVE